MRLSPISYSGTSACSRNTRASNRYSSLTFPQTQVPAPDGAFGKSFDLEVEIEIAVLAVVVGVHRLAPVACA